MLLKDDRKEIQLTAVYQVKATIYTTKKVIVAHKQRYEPVYDKGDSMKVLLSRYEGYRNCRYSDAKGVMTIGIGWNLSSNREVTGKLIGVTMPTCITDTKVNTLYEYSVRRAAEELYKYLPWSRDLARGVRDVLVRMSFNMGMGALLGFKNTLAALKARDYRKAANGFRASQWCRDVKMRRCSEETAKIAEGV